MNQPEPEYAHDQNPAVHDVHLVDGPGTTLCRRPGSCGKTSIGFGALLCLWCVEESLVQQLAQVRGQIKQKEERR